MEASQEITNRICKQPRNFTSWLHLNNKKYNFNTQRPMFIEMLFAIAKIGNNPDIQQQMSG